MNDATSFNTLKTVPGITKGVTYVVIAEDSDQFVAIKPEAQMVAFSPMIRFFQIGFRIHVRPQAGKELGIREAVQESLNIGYLSDRDDATPRYVGTVRIPVCNPTLSPWVVQEHIVKGELIEKLVAGLYERLSESGLTIIVPQDALLTLARERFLDMIPNDATPLPEVKCYFGKDSYNPPEPSGPPKEQVGLTGVGSDGASGSMGPGGPKFGDGEGDH